MCAVTVAAVNMAVVMVVVVVVFCSWWRGAGWRGKREQQGVHRHELKTQTTPTATTCLLALFDLHPAVGQLLQLGLELVGALIRLLQVLPDARVVH